MGGIQVVWIILAAFAAALGAWLFVKARQLGRWLAARISRGFDNWFGEAVDRHIEPKFAALRSEVHAAVDTVSNDLQIHTEQEAQITREVVRSELAPVLYAILNPSAEAAPGGSPHAGYSPTST